MGHLPNSELLVSEKLGTRAVVCPQHGEYQASGSRLPRSNGIGREVWTRCPSCIADQEAAEHRRREEEAAQSRRAELEAKPQLAALTAARDYVENFNQHLRDGSGLILSGLPGTGKSHIAGAILQALLPEHVGMYATCMQAIRTVRETWRRDSERSERQVLDTFGKVAILVLDEIGVQYGTESEQTIIFDILDRRYRDMKPSILLTNQDREGLKSFIGERAYDRLTETSRWIAFDWPSYRVQARREAAMRA
jgi:DNA replication protein DnaC